MIAQGLSEKKLLDVARGAEVKLSLEKKVWKRLVRLASKLLASYRQSIDEDIAALSGPLGRGVRAVITLRLGEKRILSAALQGAEEQLKRVEALRAQQRERKKKLN